MEDGALGTHGCGQGLSMIPGFIRVEVVITAVSVLLVDDVRPLDASVERLSRLAVA